MTIVEGTIRDAIEKHGTQATLLAFVEYCRSEAGIAQGEGREHDATKWMILANNLQDVIDDVNGVSK